MSQFLKGLALVVRDYDEAIAYYCGVLGFTLEEDSAMGNGKRWVVVAPRGARECRLILARAKNEAESAAVGNQAGGRVFLFLHTDNFEADYRRMLQNGVQFVEQPRKEEYGRVVVFADLYGNRWDMVEPKVNSLATL